MKPRFIFLGLDGQNPEFVERYLDDLPTFKRLIRDGCWGPLLSTFPADTPTNWTALATGARASRSNITGFAFHEPGTSLRDSYFGPREFARFRNAEFFWEAAARQERKSILINYPFAWHSREDEKYAVIGGDSISGGICQAMECGCFCTLDLVDALVDAVPCETNPSDDGYETTLTFATDYRFDWTATGVEKVHDPDAGGSTLSLKVKTGPGWMRLYSMAGREVAHLKKGQWSTYFDISFVQERVWLKVFLADLSESGDSFILFHSPLTWNRGWTKPERLAPLMLREGGPYQQAVETKGNLYTNGWFGEYALEASIELLRDCGRQFVNYARIMTADMPDWDSMFIQLHSTDGMNHRRLCQLDPDSPISSPEKAAETDRWMRECYKATDEILFGVAKLAEETGAVVVVTSDHSAVPTHTWVDTARPFIERDLLAFDSAGKWDPARSSIRKMINHSIYINEKGREPEGIVEPDEYEKLRDEIIRILLDMRDPRTGECPIAVAARKEDLDSIGANGPGFGDIVYLMRPGYTNQPASEAELLTEEKLGRFVADPKKGLADGYCFHRSIQGNHHDYLPNAEYPGVCSNRGVLLIHGPGVPGGRRIVNARTIDVAPTLAALMGIDPPKDAEGLVLPDVVAGMREKV